MGVRHAVVHCDSVEERSVQALVGMEPALSGTDLQPPRQRR